MRAEALMVTRALLLVALASSGLLGWVLLDTFGTRGALGTWRAEHEYELTFDAGDERGYIVAVPFLVAFEQDAAPALAKLSGTLALLSGRGEASWLEGRALVQVEGNGPVVVRAARSFFGGVGEREAFIGWRLAALNVTRDSTGPDAVSVHVDLHLSGGRGHTCWSDVELGANVGRGESVELEVLSAFEGETVSTLVHDHLPVVCA